MTAILNEESRSPAPHLCLSFAASSQIFSAISKIAATSHNEALVREAVGFFSALIDSEEEDFLANERFADALMTFISKIASSSSLVAGEDTDAEIVELLFGIAAKIRLEPELLPVWFSSRGKVDSDGGAVQQVGFAGVIRKEDFPLCYQLIDHVHHEGRIGDFARTGLLYIFETASKSQDLEQWIVESDLATLMASGLGALYSQLSRKLSIVHPKDDLPIILQLSDYPEIEKSISDAENVFSEDFKIHMETFLSYLAFWQDVLEHCRSPDVRQTLIDHFQVLFLQQLLYPSLFESSDVDGGSAVAVLNYLRRILDALDHPELVHMILRYLLALPDEQVNRPRSRSVKKRRSTLMLLSKPNDKEPELNPSLFNLVDLLLNCTQSRNPQTVASALKLVTTILSKNHKYATGTLVNVTEVHNKDPLRTIGALHAEIESYLGLAEDMVPGAEVNKEYEAFLKDVLNLLEAHPCSMKHLSLHGLNLPNQAADFLHAEIRKDSTIHHLTAGDALFKSLMSILSNFFTNNVETNLNLTEAIVNLASCPNLRLEGWLAVEPTNYQFNPNETFDDEDEDLRDIFRARRRPKWTPTGAPALMVALRSLQEQIECLREEIPDFNQHVANRKQAFRVHEELNEAMRSTAHFPPPTPLGPPKSSHGETPTGPGSWTPQFQNMLEGTISPLRSQSPRGRAHTIQPTVRLSPAPVPGGPKPPRLDPTLSPSPHPTSSASRSPVRSSARGISPAKPLASVPDPRRPSLTATVLNDVNDAANAEILKRVIKFPLRKQQKVVEEFPALDEEIANFEIEREEEVREASLSHVLTNVVILQEFVLELIAILQVRASLFQEVRFV
ncbi:Armadillo-like helical [Macrophomina phaseolina MS6]|uniref:Armadillo-like helical n=1 Tax=Macrophomina phaseolina (strain MS6) TaxID=1126212 RepID=K2RDX5_MACPH|nr:Armadillo-like helical [Macrophomina phaseolina MS6]